MRYGLRLAKEDIAMDPLNKRTAADMAREYESGIDDIDQKIEVLREENKKDPSPDMNKRICALEVMRGDMAHQLWMLRKYADV